MPDFMSFPTPREHVLTCGNTTIGVIPEICLITHFQVGSWQILYRPTQTGNIKRWGVPLMIPNFSRLNNDTFKEKGTKLPIHGFGRILPWTIIEKDSTHLVIQLSSSNATLAIYPYDFTFIVNISVEEGILTYRLTMENHSNENMPIAPGFHPYFMVAQLEKMNLKADGLSGFEAQAFDWVEHIPDNPYPFQHDVTLQFPGNGTLIVAEIPLNSQYVLTNMQVWSEPPTKPDHNFICFEPTVGSEDTLNRPADRLNIDQHSSRQIVLQLQAKPQ
jgi:galactose mutarotase-like enzyme